MLKFQYNILLETLKKMYKWFVLLLLITICIVITILIRPHIIKVTNYDLFGLIFYPKIQGNLIYKLMTYYKMVLLIVFFYKYYTYEQSNSIENILPRTNKNDWFVSKVLVGLIALILFRILNTFLIYYLFRHSLSFSIGFLSYPIIYSIIIFFIIITYINIFKINYAFLFLLIFTTSIIITVFFNFIFASILLIILFVLNTVIFDFKKYYK